MAGYTTIEIVGQQVGLRFGLPAIKRISDKINLLSGTEEITLNLMSMVHILYAGYVNDCLANDKDPNIEFKVFYDFVEESAMNDKLGEIKRVIEVFANSKEVKDREDTKEEKKSKSLSTGTKLKRSA
jgi:hypothetical protein